MADRRDIPDSINELSERVIGCAIEVQKVLGRGLLESVYEAALCREFELADIPFRRQATHVGEYKGVPLPTQRFDLLIDGTIIIKLKAVEKVSDAHLAQILSYIRLANKPLGLLINFNAPTITKGTHRRINTESLSPQ